MKFEKFVAENEVKRLQAMKKYDTAREQNKLKQKEIEDLTEQLKQRRGRWELETRAVWWGNGLWMNIPFSEWKRNVHLLHTLCW